MTIQPQIMMKNRILLFFLLITFYSFGQSKTNVSIYTCANKIQVNQPHLLLNTGYDYEEEDLDLITLITDQIIKDNPGKEGYEVFFADRNESRIVVLIIGIHQLKQIDKTTCDLFSNSNIKWPPYSTILYFDDTPKNNFIVALSKK